jgi:hypothetical protein
LYGNTEPWDKNVPAELIPAIKHLRKSFDEAHWGCGQTTQTVCYALLHHESVDDPRKEYLNYLKHMKARVGQVATHCFHSLVKEGTLPAVFKAFFDLYLEGVSVRALEIFKELVEIGRANEKRLGASHLEWAEAQAKHLIRSHSHNIRIWVQNVCDKRVYDPNEDPDELVFWRKWQAPSFLIMMPSLYRPFDPAAVWERKDAESSWKLLQHFGEHYVVHLEVKLRKTAGEKALELAKKPIPTHTEAADRDSPQQNLSNSAAMVQQQIDHATIPVRSVRREARKLDTQSMHENWRREYRKLKKNRPNMSDVWYSQQIAKLAIANERSAETIRKHMTT